MSKPNEDDLDKVQHEIDDARKKAEADGLIADPEHHKHRYYESGDEESEKDDDQNASPM